MMMCGEKNQTKVYPAAGLLGDATRASSSGFIFFFFFLHYIYGDDDRGRACV